MTTTVKSLVATALALITIFAGAGIYSYYKSNNTFLGHKIEYQNHYISVTQLTVLGPNNYLWSECVETSTDLIITADTVLFKTDRGNLGFKPISVGSHGELVCKNEYGVTNVLYRYSPEDLPKTKENEMMVLAEQNATLVFNTHPSCLGQKSK